MIYTLLQFCVPYLTLLLRYFFRSSLDAVYVLLYSIGAHTPALLPSECRETSSCHALRPPTNFFFFLSVSWRGYVQSAVPFQLSFVASLSCLTLFHTWCTESFFPSFSCHLFFFRWHVSLIYSSPHSFRPSRQVSFVRPLRSSPCAKLTPYFSRLSLSGFRRALLLSWTSPLGCFRSVCFARYVSLGILRFVLPRAPSGWVQWTRLPLVCEFCFSPFSLEKMDSTIYMTQVILVPFFISFFPWSLYCFKFR